MPQRVLPAILLLLMTHAPVTADPAFARLAPDQKLHGFRARAVYLDDADAPMGARFVHEGSGFTLDLLQLESVPQGFTWVNTVPVSDQGEPHTQEHLLLGKGTVGRSFAGLGAMWMMSSSAFTLQWRTCYHFHTTAGSGVFFDYVGRQLDALLHPNYTDEEIRREVRNFGVTQNPDGTLRLEEKGTVYNEMVSSNATPYRALFNTARRLTYGSDHPIAWNAGGEPSGIRTMKPEHIRDFHAQTHYLANMGMIAALPRSVLLADALTRIDALLAKVQGEAKVREPRALNVVPPPRQGAAGTIAYGEYPHRNAQQPSPVGLYWPATRTLSPDEQLLAEMFFDNLAGDPTTNLYKLFIDSKTRKVDIGAKQVSSSVGEEPGYPIGITFIDVPPVHFDDAKLAAVRTAVLDEIARVAAFGDGSPELLEFNERVSGRLVERRRAAARYVNSPPGFGLRGTGPGWMSHLRMLEGTADFKKSLTLKPQIAFVRSRLESKKNFWRDALARWQVTGVTPFVVAARPSPAMVEREDKERVARTEAEAVRLKDAYGAADVQEALRRYRTEQDAETARIEETARGVVAPALVKTVPMTLDDDLQYETRTLDGGIPWVASRFASMSSASVGLVLRADGVTPEHYRYLSLLPALMARVGVIENGRAVSYEEMTERVRREILELDAYFSTNPRTSRVELVVRGAGLGADEARRALQWMKLLLSAPNWRPDNLPRIRDLVDQSHSNLRNTMQQSEESWVQNPPLAYRTQRRPAFLAATSFLTRGHNALRLRWLLRDPENAADGEALGALLTRLSTAAKTSGRGDLKALLAKPETLEGLTRAARTLAAEMLKDIDLALVEIPDSSLAADWEYLCLALRDDLRTPAAEGLARLGDLRRQLLRAGHARVFSVSSPTIEAALAPDIAALVATLDRTAPLPAAVDTRPHIEARLREREPEAKPGALHHLGLFCPTKTGGVIVSSVPSPHYSDPLDREKQLEVLAGSLFSGGGAHTVFTKTIGAGLAYSNGVRPNATSARLVYYAERTPELPQTVRFVVKELKDSPRDPRLAEYAIAQAVGETRGASAYESRAEAIAADLADGQPPDHVRRFRTSLLALRKEPGLGDMLFDRKDKVHARILPGYDAKAPAVPDAVHFVIGPEKQLDAWQAYLREVEGSEARLHRLYARDFWMP